MPDCPALIGLTEADLTRRFGEPTARRARGRELWLVYETRSLRLRIRCSDGDAHRVASWTASFPTGHSTLRAAARVLSLWPAAGPDEVAGASGAPLIRRALACPACAEAHSLTATVRSGRIMQLSVFDEPPEWL